VIIKRRTILWIFKNLIHMLIKTRTFANILKATLKQIIDPLMFFLY